MIGGVETGFADAADYRGSAATVADVLGLDAVQLAVTYVVATLLAAFGSTWLGASAGWTPDAGMSAARREPLLSH